MPLGIRVTDAAQRLGFARNTLSRIINGRSGISLPWRRYTLN
ncbi:helix-turn-helix transcriptional regulator [Agrobacterium rubi]